MFLSRVNLTPTQSCVVTVLHTSFNTLLIRYVHSRLLFPTGTTPPNVIPPLASTSVLFGEFFKATFAIFVLIMIDGGSWVDRARARGWWLRLQLAVPAILYGVQNQLSYHSLRYVDAPTVQVLGQLRVLFTAAFSVAFLGKKLKGLQWAALVLLILGALVLNMTGTDPVAQMRLAISSISSAGNVSGGAIGVGCVVLVSVISSYSGIYIERLMKSKNIPFLDFNLELATFSIFTSGAMVLLQDSAVVREKGIFVGHDWLSLLTAMDCGIAGILISLVVAKTSTITKVHLTVLSNILTCSVSVVATRALPSVYFIVGCATVLFGVWLFYSNEESAAAEVAPKRSKDD